MRRRCGYRRSTAAAALFTGSNGGGATATTTRLALALLLVLPLLVARVVAAGPSWVPPPPPNMDPKRYAVWRDEFIHAGRPMPRYMTPQRRHESDAAYWWRQSEEFAVKQHAADRAYEKCMEKIVRARPRFLHCVGGCSQF
jgi:pimeloyl-ACP methyl ester carboxylesterase